jgi:Na+/proline symporter
VNEYQIGVILLLALYLAVGVSMYVLVRKSGRRFIVAGKKLPLLIVGTMLFAQALDGNAALGGPATAAEFGFWAGFAFPLGIAISVFLVGAFFAKPLNRMNLITLPDFYMRRYSRRVELLAAILMIISFIILVAGNLAAAGIIIDLLFGIDYGMALLLMTVLVLAYTFSGGLFSSAATDVVQLYPALAAFIIAPIILVATFGWDFFAAAIPPGFLDLSGLTDVTNPDSGALLNWSTLIAIGLGDIIALDFMERVFAAKDPKTAQRACYYGAFFTVIAGFGAVMLGLMGLALYPDLVDRTETINLIAIDHMPFLVGLFMMAGVLGAGMSTANGGALAVSAVIGRNVLLRNIVMPYEERKAARLHESVEELNVDWHRLDQRLLSIARIGLLPVFAASVWYAYVEPNPGVMLALAFDVVLAGCFAPLVLGIYWKKANTYGALASIIIGSGLRVLLFPDVLAALGLPPLEPGLATIIPPIVSFILMVGVSIATQERQPSKWEIINYEATEEELARGTM